MVLDFQVVLVVLDVGVLLEGVVQVGESLVVGPLSGVVVVQSVQQHVMEQLSHHPRPGQEQLEELTPQEILA